MHSHGMTRNGDPRRNLAKFIDPPARPVARPAVPPVCGEPRVAAMIDAQRNTLASRVAQREKAFNACADAVQAARVLRTKYDTRETRSGIVAANEACAFASEGLEVAKRAAQDFADLLARSTVELARLAEHDALQAEQAILATNQQIVADATRAGVAFAAVLVFAREQDAAVAHARGEAQMLARSLGLQWSPCPLGYLQFRTAIRDALRASFIARGLDLQILESCVR